MQLLQNVLHLLYSTDFLLGFIEPLAKKQEIRDRCCRLHHNILDLRSTGLQREETGLYKGFIFCVA